MFKLNSKLELVVIGLENPTSSTFSLNLKINPKKAEPKPQICCIVATQYEPLHVPNKMVELWNVTPYTFWKSNYTKQLEQVESHKATIFELRSRKNKKMLSFFLPMQLQDSTVTFGGAKLRMKSRVSKLPLFRHVLLMQTLISWCCDNNFLFLSMSSFISPIARTHKPLDSSCLDTPLLLNKCCFSPPLLVWTFRENWRLLWHWLRLGQLWRWITNMDCVFNAGAIAITTTLKTSQDSALQQIS